MDKLCLRGQYVEEEIYAQRVYRVLIVMESPSVSVNALAEAEEGGAPTKCPVPSGSRTSPPLPQSIVGYYTLTWLRQMTDKPDQGQTGANIGVTFPGASMTSTNGSWLASKFCPPQTLPSGSSTGLNFMSIGGGGGNPWNHEDVTAYKAYIPSLKTYHYDGVCFDIETGNATVDEFKEIFSATKAAGLKVMVTISYFAATWDPDLSKNIVELVNTVFTNSQYVDILSPQLYTGDCDDGSAWNGTLGGGDWNGTLAVQCHDAYKSCKFLAPSINSNNWSTIKKRWLSLGLPNPLGYFQFCNKYTT